MEKDYVMAELQRAGYKLTPQRRAIVDVLLNFDGLPTAFDLHERLAPTYPDLSLDTVYRTLKLLMKLGLVIQMDIRAGRKSRFKLADEPHHHHLICLKCGIAVCLDYCPLAEKKELADCEIVSHTFELYGYCKKCRKEGRS